VVDEKVKQFMLRRLCSLQVAYADFPLHNEKRTMMYANQFHNSLKMDFCNLALIEAAKGIMKLTHV